jgi:hypothetical protein
VGFNSYWINRSEMPDEYRDFPPKQVLGDLTALAALA